MVKQVKTEKPTFLQLDHFLLEFAGLLSDDFSSKLGGPFLLCRIKGQDHSVLNLAKQPDSFILGRHKCSDVVLDCETISRIHVRFDHTSQGWRVADLNSSNGTVTKRRLTPFESVALTSGQRLLLGDQVSLLLLNASDFHAYCHKLLAKGCAVKRSSDRLNKKRRSSTTVMLPPQTVLEQQRACPRSLAQLAQETARMSDQEFLRCFRTPVLVMVSGPETSEQKLFGRTQRFQRMSTDTRLSHMKFWLLSSKDDPSYVRVGRDENNDIVIKHESVSRYHGVFMKIKDPERGDHWILEDLGSINGSFIDGQRVRGSVPVKDQVLIRLGTKYVFQLMSPQALWRFTRLLQDYPYLEAS